MEIFQTRIFGAHAKKGTTGPAAFYEPRGHCISHCSKIKPPHQ